MSGARISNKTHHRLVSCIRDGGQYHSHCPFHLEYGRGKFRLKNVLWPRYGGRRPRMADVGIGCTSARRIAIRSSGAMVICFAGILEILFTLLGCAVASVMAMRHCIAAAASVRTEFVMRRRRIRRSSFMRLPCPFDRPFDLWI